MKDIVSCALDLGLPVFPCRNTPENKATDKAPLTKNGYLDASDDPAKIRAMFARRDGCLIGVPTGAISAFDVLDVDQRNGGREWYEAHKSKLRATRAHRTRSGGLHLMFKHLDGLRCTAGKIAPGIDVRADGGYVIWWPATGLEFKDYPPDGLPAWPEWLLPSMISKPVAPTPIYSREPFKGATPSKLRAVIGVLRIIVAAPVGERNQRLFWAACRFSEMVDDGLITRRYADELLMRGGASAGLSGKEILTTGRSASNRGRR